MPTIDIKVNCDDVFVEGDCENENCERGGTLTQLLKEAVVSETVHKLTQQVSDATKKAITNEALERIKKKVDVIVDVKVSEISSEYIIKKGYGSNQTLIEYISNEIEHRVSAQNFSRMIDDVCTGYVKTIKERFDKLFAAQLIDKMMKANLLKDDRIAQLLLEPEPK